MPVVKALGPLLMLFASLLISPSVLAQDATVTAIPIHSELYSLRLSPDGQWAAIHENPQIHNFELFADYLPIRILDLQTQREVLTLSGASDYAVAVDFTPDNATLASLHGGGYVQFWDLATGAALERLPVLPGGSGLMYLPDGQRLAISYDRGIMIWDTEAGSIVQVLTQRFETYADFRAELERNFGLLESAVAMQTLPDGNTLVTVSAWGNIRLWDLTTGADSPLRLSTDEQPMFNIRSLSLSADGAELWYFDRGDNALHRWDLAQREEIAVEAVEAESPMAIAWDSQGQRLAYFSRDTPAVYIMGPDGAVESHVFTSEDEVPVGLPQLSFVGGGNQLLLSGFRAEDGDNALYVIALDSA